MKKTGNKTRAIWSFSLYGGWLLALLFQGPVLFELLGDNLSDSRVFPMGLIAAHASGLILSGFVTKSLTQAKVTLILATLVSFLGSAFFYTPYNPLWGGVMMTLGFSSGLYIGSWAFYLKVLFQAKDRFRAVAEILIYSNFLLMLLSVLTMTLGPAIGLGAAMMLPVLSLAALLRINFGEFIEPEMEGISLEVLLKHQKKSFKPLVLLGAFILMITINSGIMYEVVAPAFGHLPGISSYYFVLPYILAIFLVQRLPRGKPRAYTLYIGLSLLGLSYILFILMDRSIPAYLWINGLMLGALGIFDLFWWSILAGFFDYYKNPAKIFGIGLGINVTGITIGGMVGAELYGIGQSTVVSLVALGLLFAVVMILPVLNEQLIFVLGSHGFLYPVPVLGEERRKSMGMEPLTGKESLKEERENENGGEPGEVEGMPSDDILTPREQEISELLVMGYTYKAVANELYLSENTVKYHVKNIYGKFGVRTKMEFIRKKSCQN